MRCKKLELIRSFAVLATRCHFGEAAKQLNISQPSLTKQIRRLEDMLGATLFQRSRQGTELTAFGRRFLDDVMPMLRHADNVWDKGLKAARGERGHLSIGFTFSAIDIMSRILIPFQEKHPAIYLSFDDVASNLQVARIGEGALDAGFVRLPIQAELAVQRVATDRLAFVFPSRLDGAVDDFTSPSLRTLPFIALQEQMSPGLERHIQRLFAARGFQPARTHRVNASLTVLSMVASGLGVGLMHESSLRGFVDPHGAVRVRIIDDDVARWDIGLAWRPGEQSPAVIRFLHAARDALATTGAERKAWPVPPLAARR